MIPRWRLVVLLALLEGSARAADGSCACVVVEAPEHHRTSVKVRGAAKFLPVHLNQHLQLGDLLRTDGPPAISLVCGGSGRLTLPNKPVLQPVPCKDGTPEIPSTLGDFDLYMGGTDQQLVVLAPRRTTIRTTRPLLRWRSISGAAYYDVAVRGEGLSWTRHVSATQGAIAEMAYPSDAPPLVRGEAYTLVVSGSGFTSDTTSIPNLGFFVLTQDAERRLANAEASIAGWHLGEESQAIVHAQMLSGYGLFDEARTVLQPLRDTGGFEVQRYSGQLLARMGLFEEARAEYERALLSGPSPKDASMEEAEMSEELGHVLRALGDDQAAHGAFDRAAAGYTKAGNPGRAKLARQQASDL